MTAYSTLATLFGLGFFSGLNLYAVVLVSGVAIRFGWLSLAPQLKSLETLSHTPVLIAAGVLYGIEFVADKIPWVDNVWDGIHTVVRPLAAAYLALHVLGDQSPELRIVAALVCGSLALTSHAAKAGTRLSTNVLSPVEPVSNITLSLAEDAIAVGSLYFVYRHPFVALGIVTILIALIVWFAPRLYRAIRSLFRKPPKPEAA
jgi:hypothetical protein